MLAAVFLCAVSQLKTRLIVILLTDNTKRQTNMSKKNRKQGRAMTLGSRSAQASRSPMAGGSPSMGSPIGAIAGTQGGNPYNPIVKVEGPQQFYDEAKRLREAGFVEVPGFFGSPSPNGGPGSDYADYISSKLECSDGGKGSLPLLHVSSGIAINTETASGYKGSYITWGAGNRIPNVISLLCSLLPYTAAALKFNIDMCCGMGPRPMYSYTQYVGGNITHKTIPYDSADKLILGLIRDLQLQLVKLEEDHPELRDGAEPVNPTPVPIPEQSSPTRSLSPAMGGEPDSGVGSKSSAEQMRDDILRQINGLRRDLAVWQSTNAEVKSFLENNNLLQTFQQLYSDMLQFNLCFPEFELQRDYLVDTGRRDKRGNTITQSVPSSRWTPKIVGLRWLNAKAMRLEQMDDNRINHVFISNQWLSSPDQTVLTKESDFKIDALPALTYQSPAKDLERITRQAREQRTPRESRPTHIVMPVAYNEYGHNYYPVPAWYSVFSGDVFTYASLLISDRKKRRDNANVIGRILYLNDEYLQRLFLQRGDDTDEKKRKRFKEIVDDINNFLKNRDRMGEPLLAYTFKDSDGKVYKSWEIVEVEENSKATAEANKEELAEISSIILFAWGVVLADKERGAHHPRQLQDRTHRGRDSVAH